MRARRRTPDADEQHGKSASGEEPSSADSSQLPAYTRGRSETPSVPLLGSQASGEGALALDEEEEAPAAEAVSPEAEVEEAKETLDAQDEGEEEVVVPAAEETAGEEELTAEPSAPEPVTGVSGVAEPEHAVAFSNLALRGRTDANFQSSFRTVDVQTSRGTGCQGCAAGQCVHVTGTLESTYTVTTTVTLPSAADFPDLTPCQRQRVTDAITNVLAPHEQQHVAAFNTYAGTTSTPFDMTICRAQFDSRIQAMHNSAQSARRAAAQAMSDALDPFVFNVDLDCEEPHAEAPQAAVTEEETEEGA